MNRLEAIDQLFQFHKAWEEGSIAKMARALGLNDELANSMTLEEIMDSLTVRTADLLKIANSIEGTPNP